MEYTVTEGFVIIETGAGNISVVVASVKLPDTVEIKGSRLVPDEMIQLVRCWNQCCSTFHFLHSECQSQYSDLIMELMENFMVDTATTQPDSR